MVPYREKDSSSTLSSTEGATVVVTPETVGATVVVTPATVGATVVPAEGSFTAQM
jgi:hypothetical protein